MKIGDTVVPKKSSGFLLRSGCSQYDCAVVVSLAPFIVISESGDMLWISTIKPEYFEVSGEATPKILKRCMERYERDKKHGNFKS